MEFMDDDSTAPVIKTEPCERDNTQLAGNTGSVAVEAAILSDRKVIPGQTFWIKLGDGVPIQEGSQVLIDAWGASGQGGSQERHFLDSLVAQNHNEQQPLTCPEAAGSYKNLYLVARVVNGQFKEIYVSHPIGHTVVQFQEQYILNDQLEVRDFATDPSNTDQQNVTEVKQLVEELQRYPDHTVPVMHFGGATPPTEKDLNGEAGHWKQGFMAATTAGSEQLLFVVVTPGGAQPLAHDFRGWFDRVVAMAGREEEHRHFAFIFTAGSADEGVVAQLAQRLKSEHTFVMFA